MKMKKIHKYSDLLRSWQHWVQSIVPWASPQKANLAILHFPSRECEFENDWSFPSICCLHLSTLPHKLVHTKPPAKDLIFWMCHLRPASTHKLVSPLLCFRRCMHVSCIMYHVSCSCMHTVVNLRILWCFNFKISLNGKFRGWLVTLFLWSTSNPSIACYSSDIHKVTWDTA